MMTRIRVIICSSLIAVMMVLSQNSSASAVSVTFPASSRNISNPYIGSVSWASDETEQQQPFSLVYAMIEWAKFEPKENTYDFESLEKAYHFDRWRKEGKHMILRFVMDLPEDKSHRDIPDWLWEKTGRDGKAYRTSYGRGYSPNYDNETLIDAHAKAVLALGERYGNDPFIAFVQLGSLGHWGEWHVHPDAGKMAQAAISDRYVFPYFEAFPSSKLMMRRPFIIAKENFMGLYNDTSGDVDSTERWLDWIENGGAYDQTGEVDGLVPMSDAWVYAPIGGELSTSHDKEDYLDEHMLEDTLRLFRLSHTSWVGPGSFVGIEHNSEYQIALDQVNRSIGYRLRVSRIEALQHTNGSVRLSLTWENSGIAPFYFDWIPSLKVIGSDGSETVLPLNIHIQDILPDSPVHVELNLDEVIQQATNYILYAGIINPQSGNAEIDLAMDTPRDGNWFELIHLIGAKD